MKKNLLPFSMLLTILLALSAAISSATAGAIRTSVSAVETPVCPDHPNCTAGEWSYPDGKIRVRDWSIVYRVDSSDPRIAGWNTLIANANWDANGYGPGWGTFHNEIDAHDGYWEGTWAAMMSANGYITRITGKGYGELDGLMFQATEVNGVLEGIITELPEN